jgi:hypothetical protein
LSSSWHIRRELAAGRRPRRDPAVEHGDLVVAEVVEHPPQPRRDPATDVVVRDDGVRVADACPGESLGEGGGGGKWMPARRAVSVVIGQVGVEIEVDRPGQMSGVIRRPAVTRPAEIPAAVDDPEIRVAGAREEGRRRNDR